MKEKERFEFGQRTLFDSGEEVTTFDGFNLDDFMQIICSLLNKQSNRIKDLELLLNADKKIETNSLNGFEKLRQENQQFKQQLEEKDKEIEEVKKSKTYIMNFGSKVKEVQVVDDNQDKISFAIAKLEKVKENIKKVPITDFDLSRNFEKMYKQDAIRQIDNQIKQLKEGE